MDHPASKPRCPFCRKGEGRLFSTAPKGQSTLWKFECGTCKRAWEATTAPGFVEVPRPSANIKQA